MAASNTDFRLSVGFFDHPKIVKLGRKLGDTGILSHIRLLRFVAQNRPDGSLRGMDSDDIAIAAGYCGDANLADILVSLRLLDMIDGELMVHDWQEHNPFAAGASKRSETAAIAANARWEKERQARENQEKGQDRAPEKCEPHASAMLPASNSNAPSFLPTTPTTPTKPTRPTTPTKPSGASPQPATAGEGIDVVVSLASLGVKTKVAQALAEKYPADLIRRQIAWLPHRSPDRPAAMIVDAVNGNWDAPPEIAGAQTEADARELALRRGDQQRQQQERSQADMDRYRQVFEALSLDDQADIHREAQELLKTERPDVLAKPEGRAKRSLVTAATIHLRNRILHERGLATEPPEADEAAGDETQNEK